MTECSFHLVVVVLPSSSSRPPLQAPLSAQVSDFTSSNDTTSASSKHPSSTETVTTASPSTPRKDKKKAKKKEKGVSKKRDPPTLGEMLSKYGVKDTYSSEESDEEDGGTPARAATPQIIVRDFSRDDGGHDNLPTASENGDNATELADALWG